QLFWVIKNGINMTGMPSFEQAGAKDDKIWSIAAFVKKLPDVSETDYRRWTGTSEPAAPVTPANQSRAVGSGQLADLTDRRPEIPTTMPTMAARTAQYPYLKSDATQTKRKDKT